MRDINNQRVKQRTVVEQVMEKIRDLIATGELKVGDKIKTEKELAENFGIGRSTVREAIKVFNYLGILESRTARGTFLCEQSGISSELINWIILLEADNIRDLLALRDSIELWIIKDMLARKDKRLNELITQLSENTASLLEFARNSEVAAFFQVKCKYHNILLSYSVNEIFGSLYSVLEKKLNDSIKAYHEYTYTELIKIAEMQREIIDKIKADDIKTVRTLYRNYSAISLELYSQEK